MCVAKRRLSMFYSIRLFIKVSWIVKCCIMIRIGGVHQHGWRQCYHLYTQCDFFFFLGNLIGGVLNGDACQSCQPLIVF